MVAAASTSCEARGKQPVFVKNGEASAAQIPKDKILKEHSGAYTTARTVDQKAIFEFAMHCHRLAQTQLAILQREQSEGRTSKHVSEALAFLRDPEQGARQLRPLVASEIRTALEWLGIEGCGVEYQVTILITCDTAGPHTPDGRGFDILTYVQPLPRVAPMVDIQARPAKRNNPTIKDVQWILDRQHLEELQRQAQVNEIIMYDEKGCVTEGLQTNFFAVSADGTVLTAPDELVLAGTVRKVVLDVVRKHRIPHRLESPRISDASTWESCFICSTSRLVKPISELRIPEADGRKVFPSADSVSHRIEVLVQEAVRENSELLLG
jgi:branched-subunit amino acid aminotransferase/4-amino-4-deoxychorismate lyase